jgi:hypothetical protein
MAEKSRTWKAVDDCGEGIEALGAFRAGLWATTFRERAGLAALRDGSGEAVLAGLSGLMGSSMM